MTTLPTGAVPTGTVTFLFTDMVSGVDDGRSHPASRRVSERVDAIIREAVAENNGYAYKKIGDGFQVAFSIPVQAVSAAIAAQRALLSEQWGNAGGSEPPRVRMALHTGVTEERNGDYVGPILNRVARVLSVCHGGQILLTNAVQELARDGLPRDVRLRDLGEHRLRDLIRSEQIFQLVAPGLPADFPPLKTLGVAHNNLPLQPTLLVGRDKEVAECSQLLRRDDVWMLTLTGTAGTGKTRVGLHVAAEVLDFFNDGVFLVSLDTVRDPDLFLPAVAQTLGVREAQGERLDASLLSYLRDKQMLLLLDNYEQIVGAASQVVQFLDSAPRLKVLVTSRMPLRVSAEYEYPIAPLPVPDRKRMPSLDALKGYGAVALFLARAQAANPSFELSTLNAASVVEICYRLDGLPLAIELAAARTRIMSPEQMLPRLTSRLKLLTGGGRDMPARQQAMRATLDWSYDLLSHEEKQLFARLAVFVGGCSMQALEAVVPAVEFAGGDLFAVLDVIGSLVDKNLLRQQEQPDGEPRFDMLQTVREYALERLEASGEASDLKLLHAGYFLGFAEQAEVELMGHNQAEWLGRLELEHDNLREALAFALSRGDRDLGLRLGGALWRFWYIHGHFSEGHRWLSDVLALPAPDDEPRTAAYAKAVKGAGNLAYTLGDYTRAQALNEESLQISRELGDRAAMPAQLNNLGHLARRRGDYAAARLLLEEGLNLSRAAGNRTMEALNLNNLGILSHEQGDYDAARKLQEESLAAFMALGDDWGTAMSLSDLGSVLFEQGDYTEARLLYERSLALQRKLGDRGEEAAALLRLGTIAHNQSNYPEAQLIFEESLAVFQDLGDKQGIADALHNLGKVAYRQGDYETARANFTRSLALREELDDKKAIAESRNNLGLVGLAQSNYTYANEQLEKSLALWREAGNKGAIPTSLNNLGLVALVQGEFKRAYNLLAESLELFQETGEKLGVAFAYTNMGLAMSGQGEYMRAQSLYAQSLNLFHELGDKLHVATCLARMAALNAQMGKAERAARLAGSAHVLLGSLGTPLAPFEERFYNPPMDAARAALGEEEFASAWAAGEANSIEQAIALAVAGIPEADQQQAGKEALQSA